MGKLKVFETIQKKFAMAGISPKLVGQSYPFNGRILVCFLLFSSAFVFVYVYMFKYAETFSEYTQSVFLGAGAILFILLLLILILKVDKLFEFIDCCDIVFNKSKLQSEAKIRNSVN